MIANQNFVANILKGLGIRQTVFIDNGGMDMKRYHELEAMEDRDEDDEKEYQMMRKKYKGKHGKQGAKGKEGKKGISPQP